MTSALVCAAGAAIAAEAMSIAWSWHISSSSSHVGDSSPGAADATPSSSTAYSLVDTSADEIDLDGVGDVGPKRGYVFYPRTANWVVRASILSSIALSTCHYVAAAFRKEAALAEDLDVVVALCQCLSVYFEAHNCLLTVFVGSTSAKLSWLPFHAAACAYYLLRLEAGSPAALLQLASAASVATVASTLVRAAVPSLTMGVTHSHPPPPELTVDMLSYFTFSYMNKDIIDLLSAKDSLAIEDVPGLGDNDSSDVIFNGACLDGDEIVTEASLISRIYHRVSGDLQVQFVLQVAGSLLNYVPPVCVHVVLAAITAGDSSGSGSEGVDSTVWLAAFMLFFAPFVQSVANGQNYVRGRHVALGVRGTIMTLLYRKLLALDLAQLKDQGVINNSISADLNEIQEFTVYIHFVWCSFFEMTVCIAVLFYELGPAAVAGVMVTLLTLPLGYFGSRRLGAFQKVILREKDARMDVVAEILLGVRIIKWYFWERNFLDRVLAVRERELLALRKYVFTDGALRATYDLIPAVVGLASFMVHTLVLGRPLTTSVGFTSLLLFSLLNGPLQTLSDMISRGTNARLSLGRIVALLNARNVQGLLSVVSSGESSQECHVRLEGVSLAYIAPGDKPAPATGSGGSSYAPVDGDIELAPLGEGFPSGGDFTTVLSNVNIAIKPGALVAVVGATGSGKSTLLLGLAGECPVVAGRVSVADPSISYVAQTSWIQNDTIRNNILFGSPLDADRYQAVLGACALEPDLLQMPHGDETEIGERGINLSGGQQQRINLARAAYSNSSLVLLDDPLSAVDSHSAEHIFEELVVGLLRAEGRTVVLVTHALSLVLPHCDKVIVLNEETKAVEVFCSPGDLGAALAGSDVTFFSLLVDAARAPSSSGGRRGSTDGDCASEVKQELGQEQGGSEDCSVETAVLPDPGLNTKDQFVQREQQAVGMIKLGVYWFYLRNCGRHALALLVLTNVLFPLAIFLQNYSLGEWIREVEAALPAGPGLRFYLLCLLLVLVSTLLKYYYHAICSLRAARAVHSRMTKAILLARMAWHDGQPTGRKMNRFSQDVSTLDGSVMNRLREFLEYVIGTCQIVCMIAATLPVLLLCLAPVLSYTNFVSQRYIRASRELKRLESVHKSPVFVHFAETMSGAPTIRCFRREDLFMRRLFAFLDRMNACHFYNWASNRWLNCRTQALGAAVSGLVAFCLLLEMGRVSPTLSGIILLYSQQFTENITFLTRCHAECQNAMNSVERIQEYCQVESEDYYPEQRGGPATAGDGEGDESFLPAAPSPWLPIGWPVGGGIEFDGIYLSYRPTEPDILKGVSFRVDSGMKVGVVGRSGAGKSSLLTALFRTVEPSAGRLFIDGVDVLQVGLGELRSILAIVPQEPVLFKGTVRSNLDPFSEHSDLLLWDALAKVKLSAFVSALPGPSLDDKVVSERGSNLSLGQRQLMCLCRALLRRPKMLILDEATASVDAEADACLQETIKSEFKDCTVLSIAHRLKTVAYFDKILVMDEGRVTEFASPLQLLADPESIFYRMCERSGDLASIIDIAKAAAKVEGTQQPPSSPPMQ